MKRLVLILSLLVSCIIDTAAANILYFNQDCNGDIPMGADNTCEDERHNLLNILGAQGHNITLLPDFHQPNMLSLLEANDFFVIPDLEDVGVCHSDSNSFITPSEKTILNNYVENGGGILMIGTSQNIAFINSVFSLGLIDGGNTDMGFSVKNVADATGTSFESCSDMIPNFSATYLVTSSMPSNKKCIYEFGANTTLAIFSKGSGTIVYMGYDFYDAGPTCTNDANEWVGCGLDNAVVTLAQSAPLPVPTLSQWAVSILLLLLMIFAAVSLRPNSVLSS